MMKIIKPTSIMLLFLGGILSLSCAGNQKNKVENSQVVGEDTVMVKSSRTCRDTLTEIPYNIPAQRFDETAQALAHASGCFIKTDLNVTGSVKVNAVTGKISILDALRMAIKDTPLKIAEIKPNEITVELTKE